VFWASWPFLTAQIIPYSLWLVKYIIAGVKAVDKGLSSETRKWKLETRGGKGKERVSGTPPTRAVLEKRLQAIEKKGWRCEIFAKERSKRRQALRGKGVGR
jgi:hypothetical protein